MIQARLRKAFREAGNQSYNLDVEFQAGDRVTVLFGPSGSGKTLILDSIAGFVRPDEGRILLDDDILFDGATGVHLTPQARNCGYVFQKYALFPHMTLRENLIFAAERQPRLERHRRVNDIIEKFRLTDAASRKPHEVSGGQRQRCSIARAIIGAPRVLLLDEPTQGLDAPLKAEFFEIIRQVRAEFKTPVLMVTHDLEECFELGEEMLILREGRIIQSGAPRKILDSPANIDVARLLGAFNLIPAEIRSLDPGRNLSRVQIGEHEIEGPYFPGHFKGDRVTICIRPDQLLAHPRNGRPQANEVPVILERAIEQPHGMRLEFNGSVAGPLAAMLARADFEVNHDAREWVIQFPSSTLRIL